MIKLQKTICGSVLAAGMLLSMGAAQAAFFNYTITGDVLLGNEYGDYNAFGLAEGDTITATGVFDDSVLTAGTGTISFGYLSGNTMTLNIGGEVLSASNDIDFGDGMAVPSISLSNFNLVDFDYVAAMGINGSSVTFDSYLTGFDDSSFLYGEWRTSIVMTPVSVVPVPAAVWLFGSGLIGLAGFARRQRSV